MNTPESTGSISASPTNTVPNPAYPNPPGGLTPDLQLAQWPNPQGASFQPMPDPGKPDPMNYQLVGDPTCGGYEPGNPAPAAPNLAGVDGWPPAAAALVPADTLFPGTKATIILPEYGQPDLSEPPLHTAHLADDGISFEPRQEFDPDPLLPDLTSYNQPMGLAMHNSTGDTNDLLRPDPVLADLLHPDLPDGIATLRHLLAPDPLVPDLQDPQLDQAVHMLDRPGDLDRSALNVMNSDPTAQATSGVPYAQSFLDASGMNTTRRRHMDLMMNGLKAEER